VPHFKSRGDVVEAKQFLATNESCWEIVQWVRSAGKTANRAHEIFAISGLYVETINGTVLLRDKEWLIQEVDGRFSTCRPAMFKIMYDPVN
jgi:hypothetical protein